MERPSHIAQAHWYEWVIGSAVDPELTAVNVGSLGGTTAYEYLLYSSDIPRRNDGRLTEHWLKKYRHTENGGWWVGTVFNSLWGCFKPDKPRRNNHETKKPIKYEHPPRVATGVFGLNVPLSVWERIAASCGVALPENRALYTFSGLYQLFWEWVVQHTHIPVIITEGAKKAAALLSCGFVAIALPGIFNGYHQPKDEETGEKTGSASLIPQLAQFATPGRPIYLAFDQDEKPRTVASVKQAIGKTGWLLEQRSCQVRVIEWHSALGKGVDDLIVGHGVCAFRAAYNAASLLSVWKAQGLFQLTYSPSVQVNRRYLGNIPLPPTAKIVGIKGGKGVGKTKTISDWVAEAISNGQWVLVITHRIQLGEALCQRFGLPYVTEIRDCETGVLFGYGLCADSLHPKSQARFQAELWSDGIVIIDEAEQVIWHMLNSTTCQRDRVSILRSFKTLIQNVLESDDGMVILSDADLSNVTIDYIKQLSSVNVTPYIIQNDWKPEEGWTVHQYGGNSPAELCGDLVAHIEAGGKPFICVSGQKRKSKWSTTTLESFLQQLFPDKRILRIDAESVSDPTHPAYCCIPKLNQLLGGYDIVVASPSIETGVSIDITDHFTSVWGISYGICPVSSFLQSLARLRSDVDRYIWVAERGLGTIGNGSPSIKNILASQQKMTKANIQLLQTAGYDAIDVDGKFQPESLTTWAKMACRINATMPCYRASVVEALTAEGHTVISVSDEELGGYQVAEEITQTRDTQYEAERGSIAQADSITSKEYELLRDKRAKTQTERHQERKHSLELRYGVEVTPELVKMDDTGLYPQLRLLYFLSFGREYISDRDKRVAEAQVDAGSGDMWLPDFNASQMGLKISAFDRLGLTALLEQNGREVRNSDPDIKAIAALAQSNPWQIKAIFGIKVGRTENPLRIVGRLLGLAEVELEYLRREGSRGNRERVYRIVIPQGVRFDIFQVWLERDQGKREAEGVVSTSFIDQIDTEVVGHKGRCGLRARS